MLYVVLWPRSEAAQALTIFGYMNEMARFCEYAIEDARGLA